MDWRGRLRAERGERSQTWLADQVTSARDPERKRKVDQTTISNWESGVGAPTPEQLHELAKALGLTVAELIGEEPAAAPSTPEAA